MTKGCELDKAETEFECDIISTGNPTYWLSGKTSIFLVFVPKSTNFLKTGEDFDLNSCDFSLT